MSEVPLYPPVTFSIPFKVFPSRSDAGCGPAYIAECWRTTFPEGGGGGERERRRDGKKNDVPGYKLLVSRNVVPLGSGVWTCLYRGMLEKTRWSTHTPLPPLSRPCVCADTAARYKAVELGQWLQRHPEAGSSVPSCPRASHRPVTIHRARELEYTRHTKGWTPAF